MNEPFQPTRPLPTNWLELERYARELEARLTTTAGNVVELETRIAELEKRPCPNVVISAEGTAYCRLAEDEGRNLRWARDQAIKKAEEVSKNAEKAIAEVTRKNFAMIDEVAELRQQIEKSYDDFENLREDFARAAIALGELEVAVGIRETPVRGDQQADANVPARFAAVADAVRRMVGERDSSREAAELRRRIEDAEQQRDENRESAFALAAHANEKIKRLRETLTMIMAAPAYCSCSPESGCKSAVAREAARAALAATESPASGEAGESEVGRG